MSTKPSGRARRLRLVLVGLGGVAFVIGLVTALSPAAVGSGDLAPLVSLVGNDFLLVAVFGLLALLGLGSVLVARGVTGLDQAAPPDPENVHQVPLFGEPLDDFVSGADLRTWVGGTDRHEAVRERLREAAVATVMRETNCTRTEARERVDAGTWTDDEEVAVFLTESGAPGLGARLAAAIRGDSPFQQAARTAADEIADHDPEVD